MRQLTTRIRFKFWRGSFFDSRTLPVGAARKLSLAAWVIESGQKRLTSRSISAMPAATSGGLRCPPFTRGQSATPTRIPGLGEKAALHLHDVQALTPWTCLSSVASPVKVPGGSRAGAGTPAVGFPTVSQGRVRCRRIFPPSRGAWQVVSAWRSPSINPRNSARPRVRPMQE